MFPLFSHKYKALQLTFVGPMINDKVKQTKQLSAKFKLKGNRPNFGLVFRVVPHNHFPQSISAVSPD